MTTERRNWIVFGTSSISLRDFSARTWTQYYFNQSGEVFGKGEEAGSPRPTDHAVTDTEVIFKMRDAYLAKAAADPTNDPVAPEAIRAHFDQVNATLRSLEKEQAEAEPKHWKLCSNLPRAPTGGRSPMRNGLICSPITTRFEPKISYPTKTPSAMSITSVLMSPDFLYRLDMSNGLHGIFCRARSHAVVLHTSTAVPSEPLSSYALASRLSYFLWASMPDEELLRHAAASDLQKPAVLLAQARRMLKDARVRGLATEFTGNWLAFRHFETNNSVDRERFPQFNNDLREAMFQEPIRYVEDTIQNNRSVLDLLYGNYTFVNPVLAKHYGMPGVAGRPEHTGFAWTMPANMDAAVCCPWRSF